MRNLVAVLVLVVVLCVGCGGGNGNPDAKAIEDTIRGYVRTYNAGDFAQCLTYFTGYEDEEDARAFLAFMRNMAGELELRKVKDVATVPPAVPGSGSTATATVVFRIAGEESTDQMGLRQVDGQWKIVWAEETPGPTPTPAPQQYPPIRTEGCLPSTVDVAPELQGVIQVRHCLWTDEEGQVWEAFQVLNTGDRVVDFELRLLVYDAGGQELDLEGLGASVEPGACLGYCDAGSRGAAPPTTTRYSIVVSSR